MFMSVTFLILSIIHWFFNPKEQINTHKKNEIWTKFSDRRNVEFEFGRRTQLKWVLSLRCLSTKRTKRQKKRTLISAVSKRLRLWFWNVGFGICKCYSARFINRCFAYFSQLMIHISFPYHVVDRFHVTSYAVAPFTLKPAKYTKK